MAAPGKHDQSGPSCSDCSPTGAPFGALTAPPWPPRSLLNGGSSKTRLRNEDVTLPQAQPFFLPPGAGPVFWILDLPGRAKETGERNGGLFSLVEARCPSGYATPLHIHYFEDETVHVLAGQLTFFVAGRRVVAAAGSYVYQPRGVAHGFRVERESPAHILCLTVPAGANHSLHPGAADEALLEPQALELETLADLAARFNIDVLGELPGS
jgi:quercetin dioxygenase-like cupin family protein